MTDITKQLLAQLDKEFPPVSERIADKLIQQELDRRQINELLAEEDLKRPRG
jgi:hypothetical protein